MSKGIGCGFANGGLATQGCSSRAKASIRARPASASLALAFCLLPVQGQAQDNDGQFWLERKTQIVVSATRTPLKVEDAPLTISVKTADDIADELVNDIRDLVRFEPGVSVQRQPARFNAASSGTGRAGNEGFTIRGIGGNRVLVQVDGVRVPDGFSFGAQAAGRGDYVDLGLIKSVEILRGPASALYGSDGLSGAVSFTTTDPMDFLENGNLGGLVRGAYNSADNEFSETAIMAGRSGDWSAMIAYTRRDFEELKSKGTISGLGAARTKPNPQEGRSNAVLGRIVYEPMGGHKLRLTGEYLDTRLFTEGLTGRVAGVDLLEAVDTGKRKRLSLDWSWDGAGTIDFARAALYWQDGEDVQFTDEDRTLLADRERLNTFENRVFGASADARADFSTGAVGHRIVFGADGSITQQRGLRDGTVPPVGEVFPTRAFPSTEFLRGGMFAADEISLGGGRLMLYPAVRVDYYRLSPDKDPLLPNFSGAGQDGSRISPKMGAVWKINDSVRVFGNYATGFKAPEPGQVNQFFENLAYGYTSAPNPDLGPERSESFEGGIRIASNAVSLDLTAFSSRYKDFISQEVVGGSFTPGDPAIYQYVNLDHVRVKGAEARFEAQSRAGITGTVSLSYAKGNEIDPDGNRRPLSTIDPLKLVVGIGYRDRAGRFGGQFIVTHSAQKELAETASLCAPACFRPGAFTIIDTTAFVKLNEAFTLRAGIFNLLNRKYAWWSDVRGLPSTSTVTDAYTQPGRNASLSASFRF